MSKEVSLCAPVFTPGGEVTFKPASQGGKEENPLKRLFEAPSGGEAHTSKSSAEDFGDDWKEVMAKLKKEDIIDIAADIGETNVRLKKQLFASGAFFTTHELGLLESATDFVNKFLCAAQMPNDPSSYITLIQKLQLLTLEQER